VSLDRGYRPVACSCRNDWLASFRCSRVTDNQRRNTRWRQCRNEDKPSEEFDRSVSAADTYVRARIGTKTKERAAEALEATGLSISDAIRLLMLRVADERRLPFEVKVPNATTRKAMAELEAGKGKRFASVEALMADLHEDD
jgi:DNA-damage-inducible protein J